MGIFASVPIVFQQKYEHYFIKVKRKPYIWEEYGNIVPKHMGNDTLWTTN